jgi:hypothetical protein
LSDPCVREQVMGHCLLGPHPEGRRFVCHALRLVDCLGWAIRGARARAFSVAQPQQAVTHLVPQRRPTMAIGRVDLASFESTQRLGRVARVTLKACGGKVQGQQPGLIGDRFRRPLPLAQLPLSSTQAAQASNYGMARSALPAQMFEDLVDIDRAIDNARTGEPLDEREDGWRDLAGVLGSNLRERLSEGEQVGAAVRAGSFIATRAP